MKNDLYNITESELEEFDQLYEGTIDEDSFYILKAKLQLDEVLKHKFTVYKMLRKEIELDGITGRVLKSRFANIDKQMKIRRRNYFIGSVLAFVSIILAGLIFVYTGTKESLYLRYRDTEAGISIKMSGNISDLLNTVMIDIANNSYNEAALKLKDINTSDTTLFYIAYCNERMDKFDEAKETYSTLINSNSDFIRHKSIFRLALLKLKSNDNDAIQALDKIAKDTVNPYARIAKEIILSSDK